MHKKQSTTRFKQDYGEWGTFIMDAKRQLLEAEERVAELKESLRFFEQKAKVGAVLPAVLKPGGART